MSVSTSDGAKIRQRRRRKSTNRGNRVVVTKTNGAETKISPGIYLVRIGILVVGLSTILGTITAIVKQPTAPTTQITNPPGK
jgi:hypothetical protein